ncbi:uncharacterized protein L3040_001715 [Drepanopeziza brunnea f. sp. 'multigermtubi']|uniref:NDT80/PhoG like DNA-binding family protein n=1 Tax=Marssonina brunnea f. sp. multigermtubi (strain MB_m1) TaxID=1072389 RepID=K1XRX2_MARBU|nr:NDT80/PhoG like DNA-binding family protein [Drepanopeziza brunnea f. sp. 'multigermtubi' MB_m1]EKD15344.1 NDT80/PhoG like DNA-binding family protein [Drepanopeziza brunnea f. sp. 'multigermtubi' MB_m1]KAJ5051954.1 hypothetical protein L3040_001715 [Drepanopeziza brunnea f. sp. 'multigermtubi']
MDNSLNGQSSPPMSLTEVTYSIQAADGQIVKPEIFARIDKGFFMAEGDWTCYRRNYFSLNCSYTLSPTIPVGTLYLMQHSGGGPAINGFAMSIAAVVDGRDGKSIELVQHTPKRDKGPQEKPARITLSPRPPIPHGMYDSLSSRDLYSTPSFSQNPNQPAVEATFERIQFKNATANNGKRRAAQQYYHLLVELFADVGSQHPDRWVKIATRMSAPMVVRGRSPGHYQGERRGSNSSGGPSGSAGPGGSYTPSGSSGRAPGDLGMGSSSMLPGSAYTNHSTYDSRGGHHYRSSIPPLQIPMEPALSSHEEAKSSSSGIDESPCYLYCPGATLQYEGQQESRYTLPSVGEYTTNKIKNEYSAAAGSSSSNHNGGGYVLPSLVGGESVYGRGGGCGRWESVDQQTSRGFFSSSMLQQEMNIT